MFSGVPIGPTARSLGWSPTRSSPGWSELLDPLVDRRCTCSSFRSDSDWPVSSVVGGGTADRPRRRARRNTADRAEPWTDHRASVTLSARPRHSLAMSGVPANSPVGAVGCLVSRVVGAIGIRILDQGNRHVPVVRHTVPAASPDWWCREETCPRHTPCRRALTLSSAATTRGRASPHSAN